MNAVIQALFMAKQFRLTLLGLSSLSGQPALRSLQSLLAFLTYSHRNLYTPREFQRTANPPWFTPGRQHDCSEFMSYLMDICHEEQRASFALSNSMKQHYINKELGSITELPEVVSEPTSQVEDWNMVGGSMSSLCAEVDSQDDLNLIGTSRDELDLIGDSRDNLDRVGDSRDYLDRIGDSRDNLGRIGDSRDNLNRIEDSSFDQMMGSTENLETDRFDENIEDVPEAAEDCVEDENEVKDVVGELRGSRDNILVSSSRENINTSRENLNTSRSNLDISRENLNTSRSSLADEDRLSRVGSRGSLGLSRWCTEENLSSSSGSREVLNVSGSREVLNLSFNDSRSALNIPDLDARQGVNKKRIVDEKSEDGHSNSTDSGIQSVEESSHGSQDKISDHAAESGKEKEKTRPEVQTIIENFFGGRLQITVRCHSCSKDSVREDYFTHLGLSFPGKDESDDKRNSEKSNPEPGSKNQPETEFSENSTHGETEITLIKAGETETSLNCDIKQSASATAQKTYLQSTDTNSKQSLTLAIEESTSSTLANKDTNLANNESNLANKDLNLAANEDLNLAASEEANNNLSLSAASSTEPSTNLLVTEPTLSSNLSSECRLDIKISPPDTTTLSNSILSGVKPNLAHKPGVINPMQSDLTLDNLIQKYLEPELLSGCNQYYCENCDKKTDATQSFSIISSPFYLNITLNRFEYDRVLERKKKIFTKIEYPRHITINTTLLNQTELVSYRLQSIIVHSGYSSDSGHYYTWSRDTEDESLWHIFNDSMVTSSTWNNFIQQTERLSRDTPYILMYEREDIENKLEAVIPPPSLMEVVQRDNIRYAQEKRGSYSAGQGRFRPVNKDEEDDPGPGSSCTENFGQLGGGRFIF
ncbi:ubiquitin carboxyl-terminal hydrolase 38-like [Eurytemora carolleeae]|uniref:ubiquitin carboxyl-terminal hydrolase 38-like n=1 Tax=Eurytemora carolleeae TaxID=1294199 RepID=UPI000C77C766|nr:ubiquitin carboxyl-terminal hydrolase 38-like [Eurytemora carolleeae]|eukprot:XP_023336590.1 ubiquitin carboxyl-terminal hydrolase 38-like [Eurytemora affinis]